jgi:hypothetical protein
MKRKASLYQTRSYRIPVLIDVSDFSPSELEALETALIEFKPAKLTLPGDEVQKAIDTMKRRGYPKIGNLPCRLGEDELRVLISEVVNNYIGEDTPMNYRFPLLSATQSQMKSLDDVKEVVDLLLEQQELRMLSYIFNLGELKSKVYLTTKFNGLANKLADTSYKAGLAVLKEKKSKNDKVSIVTNEPEMDVLISLIKDGLKESERIDKELKDLTFMRMR